MSSNPLPVNTNPTFLPDMPGAIVYPAHPTNYYRPEDHMNISNSPKAFVMHTPEEPWDDNESTPNYFRSPNRMASTHYYMDSDGDIFQLVPERSAAIANGLFGRPLPSWARSGTSLNWQSLSVEIEGFAHSIKDTLVVGGPQFNGLVKLVRNRCQHWAIPMDRQHIVGHYELSVVRSDPGQGFPWQDLILALNWDFREGDEDMIAFVEDPTTPEFDTHLLCGARLVGPIPDYETRIELAAFYTRVYGKAISPDPTPIGKRAFTFLKSKQ